MTLASRIIFGLVAIASCAAVRAGVPTEFVVAPDKTSFRPEPALRSGDRLYVSSPHVDFDDIMALGRCLDTACSKLDIVRAWTGGKRRRISDYVNIQQDGEYVFFGSRVPRTLPEIERRGCFRSVPIRKVCSGAVPLSIAKVDSSAELFRARFSSDSWLWVRRVRAAN
jgi:hypothetical protein